MAEHPVVPASRARFRTIASEHSIPIDADDLLALAKRYADQAMYDESIHLYEMAEKLKPGSVALRINLALPNRVLMDCPENRFVLATAFRRLVRREPIRFESGAEGRIAWLEGPRAIPLYAAGSGPKMLATIVGILRVVASPARRRRV